MALCMLWQVMEREAVVNFSSLNDLKVSKTR